MKKIKDNPIKGLSFLYNKAAGRILLKILTLPIISKLFGILMDSKLSKIYIKKFIKDNNINMNLYEKVKYNSFNEFFYRKLKKKNYKYNKNDLLSPCESKLTYYKITDDLTFKVKNSTYSVKSLLKNDELSNKYRNGDLLVFRLSPDNFHRYSFICNGYIISNYKIKGVLHTVNPIVYDKYEVFKENSREVTVIESDNLNTLTYVEVGALLVGKIVNHKTFGKVSMLEEKGYFKYSGSTVILLFEKDTIKIDDKIINANKDDYEMSVNYLEKIGEILKK